MKGFVKENWYFVLLIGIISCITVILVFSSASLSGIPLSGSLFSEGSAASPGLTPAFSGSPLSGPSPLTVTFTDASSGGPTGWAWFFGDETYNQTWTQPAAFTTWSGRSGHTSVVLPDGSIVLMGGWSIDKRDMNDVWRSTDQGKTWKLQTAHAEWAARSGHTSVVLPDGSIVLMGGGTSTGLMNDVWRSTDKGITWKLQTAHAEWSQRSGHTSIVIPADGNIVLMAGISNYNEFMTDVWRSTDQGKTWTLQTALALGYLCTSTSVVLPDGSIKIMGGRDPFGAQRGVYSSTDQGKTWTLLNNNPDAVHFEARYEATSVVMSDGSIILMGGRNDNKGLDTVWRGTDYGIIWNKQTEHAEWSDRWGHTSVVLPDGSIVLMGGNSGIELMNDVWRSTDQGITWTQQTLPRRHGQTGVVTSDGSIVLMGGFGGNGIYLNDVWRSTDRGNKWTLQTAHAEWSGRGLHTSVVMPDGSIVLMGGNSGTGLMNDVWRSTDMGKTWIQLTANADWSGRYLHTSVVMPDGSIVLMGGNSGTGLMNDVWRSTDMGKTWIQRTSNAKWTGRFGQTSVAMSDGSIVLMGGISGTGVMNDVWRSTNMGKTWIQQTSNAGWSGRFGQTSVVMSDGSIVLMGGGAISTGVMNDVWRSTDLGKTWIQRTSNAEWTGRWGHTSVVMSDGSIILMGGTSNPGVITGDMNDVWCSADQGNTWTPPMAHAAWDERGFHTSVVMPDGSIVLMGGISGTGLMNDVWRSTDMGKTWTLQSASSGWFGRFGHTSVVMPDGSIILMGGNGGFGFMNDVWCSPDLGKTWTLQSASSGWAGRFVHTSVVMPDGSIVIMGGAGSTGRMNDVWRSTDLGKTWTLQSASSGWAGRHGHTSVVMPDSSIVLMGGYSESGYLNDVWRSMDMGVTWTLQNSSSGWAGRSGHTSVVMPDGSIVIMGGAGSTGRMNDVWRSTDLGKTWIRQIFNAGWTGRSSSTSVVMPDSSIVLMGGVNAISLMDDVWRLDPAGSRERKPSHTYTKPGTYPVTLQVYNYQGFNTLQKSKYIAVGMINLASFGNTGRITHPPNHPDYSTLGGASAIRRDGSVDTFIGDVALPGNDWVQITNGAAIRKDGTLKTWTPGNSGSVQTFDPVVTGRKYVAISQFSEGDWLLAIYEDPDGDTHLVVLGGKYSDHEEIYDQLPTETGWKKISAGNNHALALKSDGTLVAWGKNDYGQLNQPTNTTYEDVKAGRDFSVGLAVANPTPTAGTGGKIYAAGRDDDRQVTGMNSLPPGDYIAVAAGTTRAAALTHDGTIVFRGEPWIGVQPPTDSGYTDIVLGPDFGFALREAAPEHHVTGPISPGTMLMSREGGGEVIPFGSTIEHTHNEVTRVFAPNGTEIFWVNDAEAMQYRFPQGTTFPSSVVHYVSNYSAIIAGENYHASVYGLKNAADFQTIATGNIPTDRILLMNVTEANWFDEQNPAQPPTLPQAIYLAGEGASVAVTSRGQLLLSVPIPPANNEIPVFTVQEFSPTQWIGTVSILNSADPTESRSMLIDKTNVDPGQPLGFNIVTGNGSVGGTNVFVSAQAKLTSVNAVLSYSGVATSSQELASMTLTPRIWKKEPSGDVLVYSGKVKTCTNTKDCRVNGTFIPLWDISNITATYCANVSTWYTMSPELIAADDRIPHNIIMEDDSRGDEPVPEVIVTGELSPLTPGTSVSAENANNTVPWGGTIVHAINNGMPVTTVSDASGKPQYWADDRKAIDLGTPYGSAYPGTWIHEIPSGSNVDLGDKRSIVKYNGTLSYTEDYSLNPMNPRDIAAGSLRTSVTDVSSFNGYVEYAGGRPYTLSHLSGNWKVPSNPTSSSSKPQTIFLFNGVQGINAATGNNTIIQPVLEWYAGDTGKYWTISPWVCGEPCVHTVRLSASTGDEINGNMHYLPPDSTEPKDFWQVSITNKKTGSTKVNTTTQITNKNLLVIAGALEGYYLTEPSALPGDTKFYSNTYLDANYNPISISLSKIYPVDEPAWIKNHRGIDIDSSSGDVTLKTYST